MTEQEQAQFFDGNRAYLADDPPEYDPDIDDDIDAEQTIGGDTLQEWQMPF